MACGIAEQSRGAVPMRGIRQVCIVVVSLGLSGVVLAVDAKITQCLQINLS